MKIQNPLLLFLLTLSFAHTVFADSDVGIFLQDNLIKGVNIEAAKLGDTMQIASFRQKAKKYHCSVIVGKST